MKTQTDLKSQSVAIVNERLHKYFFLLQDDLKKFNEEVERSYALFRVGEKTPLTEAIENYIKNPTQGFLSNAKEVASVGRSIINGWVTIHLKKNAELISKACHFESGFDLNFYVSLKDDNSLHRRQIFSFFDDYQLTGFSSLFPVYIQFVPEKLFSSLPKSMEEIPLNESVSRSGKS